MPWAPDKHRGQPLPLCAGTHAQGPVVMNDRDLETMLGRYRPRGPAPELRHAVLSSGAGRRRVWPWAAAAAALLAVTVELNIATAVRERTDPDSPERAAALKR